MNGNAKWHKLNIIFDAFLIYAGISGAMMIFLSAFEIKFMDGLELVFSLAMAAAGYILFNYIFSKVKLRLFVCLVSAIAAVGLLMSSFLYYSFLGLINDLDIGIEFKECISSRLSITFIFVIISVFITFFKSSNKKAAAVATGLVTLIPCVVFERVPSAFSIMLMLIFIIGTYMYDRKNAVYPAAASAVIFLLYFVLILLFPKDNYKGFNLINKFEGMFNKTQEQNDVVTAEGGVGSRRLGTVDEIVYADKKMLTLKSGYYGNVYLKGLVGGTYYDNEWHDLLEEAYSGYEEIFNTNQSSIDTYNQQAEILEIIYNDDELAETLFGSAESYLNEVKLRKYSVSYFESAGKELWYLPYGNSFYVSKRNSPDGSPVDCVNGYISSEQYSYVNIDYDKFCAFVDEYDGDNARMNLYAEWERMYRKFVYENYTDVSDDVRETINSCEIEQQEISTLNSRLDYAHRLEHFFEENYKYTLSPGRVPEGEDFINYFLTESKQGYCTYFATSAVMFLRNAGIPARYVTGYSVDTTSGSVRGEEIIRKNALYSVKESYNSYVSEVYDSDAHAWVEIYMDGYGWIPLEFTPGYEENLENGSGSLSIDTKNDGTYGENGLDTNDDTDSGDDSNIGKNDDAAAVDTKKKDYDTLGEYLKHNKTDYIDFGIVFKILWKNFLNLLRFIAVGVLITAVVCVCIYIPAQIAAAKNKKLFVINADNNAKETARQVKDILNYLDKMCRFLNIRRTDTMSGVEFVELMKSKYDYFEQAGVEHIIYAIEKLSYGHGNIGRAEMKRVVNAINIIRKEAYAGLRFHQKLLFRFIWHL